MNEEQQFLADVLLACCDRLDSVKEAPLPYLNDVARVCVELRPAVANADTPEMLALQNLIWRTEELVLDWYLHGRCADVGFSEWLMGDVAADYAAWQKARAELAEIRGQAS